MTRRTCGGVGGLTTTVDHAPLVESSGFGVSARAQALAERARVAGRLELAIVAPDEETDVPVPCMDGWGRRYIVVAPDGLALPCHHARMLPLAFASVRDHSLRFIWEESPAFRDFRGEAWMPEPCRSCDRRAIDHGGCRCRAFLQAGDPGAGDPVWTRVIATRRSASADRPRAGQTPLQN